MQGGLPVRDFLCVVFKDITLPRNKLKGPNPLLNSSFYLLYDSELRAPKDVVEKVFNLFTLEVRTVPSIMNWVSIHTNV